MSKSKYPVRNTPVTQNEARRGTGLPSGPGANNVRVSASPTRAPVSAASSAPITRESGRERSNAPSRGASMAACTGSRANRSGGTARSSQARGRWKLPSTRACRSTKGTTAVTEERALMRRTKGGSICLCRERGACGRRRGTIHLDVVRADFHDVLDESELEAVHDGEHHGKGHHAHRNSSHGEN